MPAQKISLYFTEGSSDKVYEIHMQEQDGGFVVFGMNGRRGSALKIQHKTENKPVSEEEASAIYAALLKKQLKGGYTPNEDGVKYQGTEHAGRVTGFNVQLLNEVSLSDAGRYIEDDAWMAFQKADGERRPLGFGDNGAVGANRQGLECPLPQPVAEALAAMGAHVHMDSEAIGTGVVVFDLTHFNGEDWKTRGAEERYHKLAEIIDALDSVHKQSVAILPAAFTTQEKQALLEGCLHHEQEGLVFKRKDSLYVAGRPSTGGDQLKVKFWKFADVVFGELNSGKRSVPFHQFDEKGQKVPLGNVTIPPNVLVPEAGTVGTVKYLYAYKQGSLFEPTFQRMNPSVLPDICLTHALKYKADHVHVEPKDFMTNAKSMRP